jgi:hypothetical protein
MDMKKSFALALAVSLAGTVAAFAQDDPLSGAAERFLSTGPGRSSPASPYEFGGDKCKGAEGAAVWWGRFAGARGMLAGHGGMRFVTHTSEGCFPTGRACEAWMQALKNRYNAKPIYNQCRRGYEPGADVPPWWSPEN